MSTNFNVPQNGGDPPLPQHRTSLDTAISIVEQHTKFHLNRNTLNEERKHNLRVLYWVRCGCWRAAELELMQFLDQLLTVTLSDFWIIYSEQESDGHLIVTGKLWPKGETITARFALNQPAPRGQWQGVKDVA